MNSLRCAFFIAWRYLRGPQKEKNITFMIKVCFCSLLIATSALALVVSIMDGFEKATYERMQSIHAHVIIQSNYDGLNVDKIASVIKTEFPEILAYSPTAMHHGMLQANQYDDENDAITTVIALKGINPEAESQTSMLESKIIDAMHSKTLLDTIHDNHVLLGEKCAEQLDLIPGDTFKIWYIPEQHQGTRNITLESTEAIVGGIFKTGIEEYDASVLFCTHTFLQSMFPSTYITTMNIKLAPYASEAKTIAALKERLHLTTYSWKDLYPALVAALTLEKYASIIFLSLIILVASMNIISLLYMYIQQKRGDIAILKAMGIENKTVQTIFLLVGMIIASTASFCGLLLALAIGLLLKQYPILELPDIYYVTHLPISLHWHLFILVFILVQCISFFATLLAIKKAQHINISNVLRFEA